MNSLFKNQLILIGVLIFSFLFRVVSLAQTGQILLALGMINLLIGLAAWRGWKILRGDIAENVPLSKLDSGEAVQVGISKEHGRPSTNFVVKVIGMGLVTGIFGIILILL